MKEDSILYNLPENWTEETAFSFDHLSELVQEFVEKSATLSHKFTTPAERIISHLSFSPRHHEEHHLLKPAQETLLHR